MPPSAWLLRPGLVQLVGDIDDLRGLRLRRVDFFGDVLRDESTDLTVDARKDAQYLAAKGLGRHVDGDVGGARLRDIDNQQQRLGGSGPSAQRGVSGEPKPLPVAAL